MRRHGQITNALTYMDDQELVGVMAECEFDDIEWNTVEHETLGQVVIFEAPARPLKPVTGTMKFSFIEPESRSITLNPTKAPLFQMHMDVDVWGNEGLDISQSYKLVTTCRPLFKTSKMGAMKLGDMVGFEAKFSTLRYTQFVYGEEGDPLIGVDVKANRVWGKHGDMWPR